MTQKTQFDAETRSLLHKNEEKTQKNAEKKRKTRKKGWKKIKKKKKGEQWKFRWAMKIHFVFIESFAKRPISKKLLIEKIDF